MAQNTPEGLASVTDLGCDLILRRAGYVVLEAASAGEALLICERPISHRPALLSAR